MRARGPRNRELGLSELLADPDRARALLSRRGLLAGGLWLAGGVALGASLPPGLAPVAWAATPADTLLAGKPGLRLLNDRPLNAETPAHLLDDPVTPAARLFVRNNGRPPVDVDPGAWTLTVHGEACARPRTFSIADLRREFETVTLQLTLECGGNGRSEFRPRVPGNQWTTGAVGCPRWTGVRVADVLRACGMTEAAVYVGYLGADTHLSGDPEKTVISRGVPVQKALEPESIVAWAMNDAPIPALHGAPLRLVCAGFPGSVSGKWLTELLIRDRVHDGAKMEGSSYRVPCHPVAPGTTVPDADLCIIEAMPVKSLVTAPRSGVSVPAAEPVALRGHAWVGEGRVARVEVSTDFGRHWHPARLEAPANRLAWQRWHAVVPPLGPGYHELWSRATDDAGRTQPMVVPGWNPKGYLNNATHRVAVQAV